jgi:hypothetical protein
MASPSVNFGRRGAVKHQKVHSFKGHKFIAKYFSQPTFCSFCDKFLYRLLAASGGSYVGQDFKKRPQLGSDKIEKNLTIFKQVELDRRGWSYVLF